MLNQFEPANVWSEWSNDAKETITKLSNTVRDQVTDWNNKQKERLIRENDNLKAAVTYLKEQEIIDSSVYLEFNGKVAEIYLDIIGINANEFLANNGDINDRFLDNID